MFNFGYLLNFSLPVPILLTFLSVVYKFKKQQYLKVKVVRNFTNYATILRLVGKIIKNANDMKLSWLHFLLHIIELFPHMLIVLTPINSVAFFGRKTLITTLLPQDFVFNNNNNHHYRVVDFANWHSFRALSWLPKMMQFAFFMNFLFHHCDKSMLNHPLWLDRCMMMKSWSN